MPSLGEPRLEARWRLGYAGRELRLRARLGTHRHEAGASMILPTAAAGCKPRGRLPDSDGSLDVLPEV